MLKFTNVINVMKKYNSINRSKARSNNIRLRKIIIYNQGKIFGSPAVSNACPLLKDEKLSIIMMKTDHICLLIIKFVAQLT